MRVTGRHGMFCLVLVLLCLGTSLRAADSVRPSFPLRAADSVRPSFPLRAADSVGLSLPPRAADSVGLSLPLRADSVQVEQPRKMSWLRRVIRGFSYIDTLYVEPQHYNWSVMLQATRPFEVYQLRSNDHNEQSLTFSPRRVVKVGPYFGWRWVFLGYTFDISHSDFSSKSGKQEFSFSLYAAQVGIDVFYNRTGSDYRISNANLKDSNIDKLRGRSFDGLSVSVTGFNFYHIFNHKRFSYPAAFAQSTCQKKSCGSMLAGIGYTRNSVSFDHDKMLDLLRECEITEAGLDSALMFNELKYTNFNISAGYAYNWVFAPHFLFCASLSGALSYKKSYGKLDEKRNNYFDFNNVNFDGIGRFGLVYNNTRWYAGASAIVYLNNYHNAGLSTHNAFGNVNLYVGYNFGKRSRYKNKRT